jgi:hypothetical protein
MYRTAWAVRTSFRQCQVAAVTTTITPRRTVQA